MIDITPTKNDLYRPGLLDHLGLIPGQKVGNFGVGGAATFVADLAAAVGSTGQIVLFDVVRAALVSALTVCQTRGLKNCQAVWANLELYRAADVADGTLDAGLLANVLHQSTKQKDMLAEIGRMLKSGARLLVVDWQKEVRLPIAPPTERRLAPAYLTQLAGPLGFAAQETFPAGPYHWGLVLVKA